RRRVSPMGRGWEGDFLHYALSGQGSDGGGRGTASGCFSRRPSQTFSFRQLGRGRQKWLRCGQGWPALSHRIRLRRIQYADHRGRELVGRVGEKSVEEMSAFSKTVGRSAQRKRELGTDNRFICHLQLQ